MITFLTAARWWREAVRGSWMASGILAVCLSLLACWCVSFFFFLYYISLPWMCWFGSHCWFVGVWIYFCLFYISLPWMCRFALPCWLIGVWRFYLHFMSRYAFDCAQYQQNILIKLVSIFQVSFDFFKGRRYNETSISYVGHETQQLCKPFCIPCLFAIPLHLRCSLFTKAGVHRSYGR